MSSARGRPAFRSPAALAALAVRMPGAARALVACALLAWATPVAWGEDEPQALVTGNDYFNRYLHGDSSVLQGLGNLIATAPEPVALELLSKMAKATDAVGFQEAAVAGLHALSPAVQRASIITVALLSGGKSQYGDQIRDMLHSGQPAVALEAVKYAGFGHDDLAIPELIHLVDDSDAGVAQAARNSLLSIAGLSEGGSGTPRTSGEWSSWYQRRLATISEMVHAVRAAYGGHDHLREVSAVRELFNVTDLSTSALDALADLAQNDPDKEIRATAAQGITCMTCPARFAYDAGTYQPRPSVFDTGAPVPTAAPPAREVAAAAAAAPEQGSHAGWIILGAVAFLAVAAYLLRPRAQQAQGRPAAMLIRRPVAPPAQHAGGRAAARPAAPKSGT